MKMEHRSGCLNTEVCVPRVSCSPTAPSADPSRSLSLRSPINLQTPSTQRCSGSPCTRCVQIRPHCLHLLILILLPQFPAAWILLLFVGLLKFNLSFLPIVILALVFNVTNTVGYTYGAY